MLINDEITLLLDALEAWEKAPTMGALMGTVFSCILQDEEAANASVLDAQQKADSEIAIRRRKATMLRVKLYQMQEEMVGAALFVQPQED